MNTTKEKAVDINHVAGVNLDPVAIFRATCAEAERLESAFGDAAQLERELNRIRDALAICDNEELALGMARQLADGEVKLRVFEIRKSQAQSHWQKARSQAAAAIKMTSSSVADAAGDSFEVTGQILQAIMAPETRDYYNDSSLHLAQLEIARNSISGSGLACAPANLVQHDLGNAHRGYPEQANASYCRTALIAIQRAQDTIPTICAQADRLVAARDAMMTALKSPVGEQDNARPH